MVHTHRAGFADTAKGQLVAKKEVERHLQSIPQVERSSSPVFGEVALVEGIGGHRFGLEFYKIGTLQ